MKIFRPLWEDGAFLVPQQFQQQSRWDAHVADTVSRMAHAHPWGVLCAEFDDSALTLSRLNAIRLAVRFADGTLIDTDLADNLPPVCDLSATGLESVEVLLCLPLLSANGGNLDDGHDSARPRRWQSERVTVQELTGHERSELAVLRHALTLRLSTQENAAYLTCPVARVTRNAQGQWSLDRGFIPPMLSLSASPALVSELGDLLHRLQARRKRLMAMRRESNERMPSSPDFDKNSAIVLLCKTGEPCPKSGYWQIARPPRQGVSRNAIVMFKEGDIMPADVVDIYRARPWPSGDKHEQHEQHADWRFLGEV